MARADFFQLGFFPAAAVCGIVAPVGKAAHRLWLDGAGDFALQQDPLCLLVDIGHRNRAQQSLGVGMGRVLKQLVGGRFFNQLAQIHNRNTVGDMAYNT